MTNKEAARRSCSYARANVHEPRDMRSISNRAWTRAECRAMEIALGGGFLALAILEVMFGW